MIKGYLSKWSSLRDPRRLPPPLIHTYMYELPGGIIIFNSFSELTLYWMVWAPCLVIEPTPKKFLIRSNKTLSFWCKPKKKNNLTLKPVLHLSFLVIRTEKQPSPSIKPVTNQGSNPWWNNAFPTLPQSKIPRFTQDRSTVLSECELTTLFILLLFMFLTLLKLNVSYYEVD